MARKKKKKQYYTLQDIMSRYGLSKKTVEKYFPRPMVTDLSGHEKGVNVWTYEDVMKAVNSPQVKRIIRNNLREKRKRDEHVNAVREYLTSFDTERLTEKARSLERHFILHVGPTNSGKTYASVQALRNASSGMYLGPLRLLALEMFDTLNSDSFICNLLTGEEHIEVPGAYLTSSTIELCDYHNHYDVAVIDEAQLIEDKFRGDKWTRAIYCVDASEVHICLAPYALGLIENILNSFGADYEVIRHERLAPLGYAGTFRDISQVEAGDALIVFSRKAALAISATLEKQGVKASVIYGALPPASRREEVRKFTSGENTVVVSTDAIGMGVSLPIRRIIFCETSKYDGISTRPLNSMEIRQIAGRAGRYGMYDMGLVMSMADGRLIRSALEGEDEPVEYLTVPFPAEAIDSEYALKELLDIWSDLPTGEGFRRQDMSDARYLLSCLKTPKGASKSKVYDLITCPVDIKDPALVAYWLDCSHCLIQGAPLPEPFWDDDSLENCERLYKAFDIRHQLLRRIGEEEDRQNEKDRLCKKINEFLASDKENYMKRCRRCGRILPATYSYGICDRCFNKEKEYYMSYRRKKNEHA